MNTQGIYQGLFDLIHTHIYGGVTLTADMNLVCTLIATVGSLAFVCIPFFVVYKVLDFIFTGLR
jgi:hypothetical protein